MGGAGSMSESEDAEMPNVGSVIPGAPESSSSGVAKPPSRALVTGAVRPKSPPNPPRSPRISSPLVPGADGLLTCGRPGRRLRRRTSGLEVPVTSMTSSPMGERPVFQRTLFLMVRAEVLEFAGGIDMKPVEDREVEVPQAAAAADRPEVEAPAVERADSPDRGTSPSILMSHASKWGFARYRDDPSMHNYALPRPPFQESRSYLALRGLRTSTKPAEYKSHRRYIVQHVLAREAGEPFMYAVIRNKAITQERVTAEEWRNAHKTEHIMFPTRGASRAQ